MPEAQPVFLWRGTETCNTLVFEQREQRRDVLQVFGLRCLQSVLNAHICFLFCSLNRHIAVLEPKKCKMQNGYLGLLTILISK